MINGGDKEYQAATSTLADKMTWIYTDASNQIYQRLRYRKIKCDGMQFNLFNNDITQEHLE